MDRLTAIARPRGLGGWRGAVVLIATAVATAIVLVSYFDPSTLAAPGAGALFGYTFIGSLIVSAGGGMAMMIRQNNPWWLLTWPWAVVLVAVLFVCGSAYGLAAMH